MWLSIWSSFQSLFISDACVTMCHLCLSPVLQWQRIGAWDWSRPPYPPCKFQQLGIVGIQKSRDYRDSKNVKEQGNTSGKNRHRNVVRCKALHKATRPPQHLHRSLRQFSTAIFIHLRLQLMHLHFTLLHSISQCFLWLFLKAARFSKFI